MVRLQHPAMAESDPENSANENSHSDWEDTVTEESESLDSALAHIELEDHLSPHLACPISHLIMELPMVTPSGHSYDFTSITEWLARRPVDPLTLAPLSPSELYPNRVLQDEILEQLESLATKAEQENDLELSEAARNKLTHVRAASMPQETEALNIPRLQRMIDRCAVGAAWCSLLAWEQLLVFTTSFGAILCLLLDARNSLRLKLAMLVGRSAWSPKQPLLAAFLKYALLPNAPPCHWAWPGRVALAALRGMLVLSVAPMCVTFALGGALSVAHFSAKCNEVRAVEFERAGQNGWFLRLLQVCSGVTGLSSFVLFLRLCLDQRDSCK